MCNINNNDLSFCNIGGAVYSKSISKSLQLSVLLA
jgi:hypothetical protein